MKKFYFTKTKTALATLMLLPFFSFAQINLLQTTNNVITTATLSCGPGNNITSQNDFARLYNLTALGYSKFQVTKVSFAVHGFQLGTASNFPVSVKVYASTGGTSDANLTLKGQASINITAAMVGTVVEVPLTTPTEVTSPAMLIVVSAPHGISTSSGFFPGGNSNGQTAPGYVKAAGCGATNFTSYNDVGAANEQRIRVRPRCGIGQEQAQVHHLVVGAGLSHHHDAATVSHDPVGHGGRHQQRVKRPARVVLAVEGLRRIPADEAAQFPVAVVRTGLGQDADVDLIGAGKTGPP